MRNSFPITVRLIGQFKKKKLEESRNWNEKRCYRERNRDLENEIAEIV